VAHFKSRDQEMIEIDQHATGSSVGDDEEGRNGRPGDSDWRKREGEDTCDDDGDCCVMFRVDRRSPVTDDTIGLLNRPAPER